MAWRTVTDGVGVARVDGEAELGQLAGRGGHVQGAQRGEGGAQPVPVGGQRGELVAGVLLAAGQLQPHRRGGGARRTRVTGVRGAGICSTVTGCLPVTTSTACWPMVRPAPAATRGRCRRRPRSRRRRHRGRRRCSAARRRRPGRRWRPSPAPWRWPSSASRCSRAWRWPRRGCVAEGDAGNPAGAELRAGGHGGALGDARPLLHLVQDAFQHERAEQAHRGEEQFVVGRRGAQAVAVVWRRRRCRRTPHVRVLKNAAPSPFIADRVTMPTQTAAANYPAR